MEYKPGTREIMNSIKEYVCTTCKGYLDIGGPPSKQKRKLRIPPMATANNLQLVPHRPGDPQPNNVECLLIARNLIFSKVFELKCAGGMSMMVDQMINVPITDDDVMNTMASLPRTVGESGLIDVNFKRQIKSKNNFMQAKVDTKVVFQSLEFLKKSGHPDYNFEIDVEKYKRKCLIENLKSQFVDDLDVNLMIEYDEYERNNYKY